MGRPSRQRVQQTSLPGARGPHEARRTFELAGQVLERRAASIGRREVDTFYGGRSRGRYYTNIIIGVVVVR